MIEKLKLHRAQSPFHKLLKTYPKWFAASPFLLYPQLCPKWSLPTENEPNLTKNDDMVTETQTEQQEVTESNEFNQQMRSLKESRCLHHTSNLLQTDQKEAERDAGSHLSRREDQNNQPGCDSFDYSGDDEARPGPSTLQWYQRGRSERKLKRSRRLFERILQTIRLSTGRSDAIFVRPEERPTLKSLTNSDLRCRFLPSAL